MRMEKPAMPDRNRVRFDQIEQPFGGMAAIFGFRGGDRRCSLCREYLATVYTIPKDGVRLKEGVNYEFRLFMLNPSVKIDFQTSMFNQPALIPVLPAAAGFQFHALDDARAVFRIRRYVETLRKFDGDIDLSTFNEWVSIFPDAVSTDPQAKGRSLQVAAA